MSFDDRRALEKRASVFLGENATDVEQIGIMIIERKNNLKMGDVLSGKFEKRY